jgi:hypothetical protein
MDVVMHETLSVLAKFISHVIKIDSLTSQLLVGITT